MAETEPPAARNDTVSQVRWSRTPPALLLLTSGMEGAHKRQMHSKAHIQSNPWIPPSPKQTRSILEATRSNITKAVSGVKQRDKPLLDRIERANWNNLFIHQLEAAMAQRAREEEVFWAEGRMSPLLANCVRNFHRQVIAAIEKTTQHNRRSAPPTLRSANSLMRALSSFKLRCNAAIKSLDQLDLALCLWDLCDDVEHYVIQTRITFGLVALNNRMPRLANRPTKIVAKAFYGSLVGKHQLVHGDDSFPKPSSIRRAMNESGYHVSERTLNLWKNQIRCGTFGSHIQPKNRQ